MDAQIDTGFLSIAHFLNKDTASSRDTIMFLLAERQFGLDIALGMAKQLGWNVDTTFGFEELGTS